jgi:dihydrofolate reductase
MYGGSIARQRLEDSMRKIGSFNFITLNGFFEGPQRDITWHKHGAEESAYAMEGLKSESILLFGRVTYEMMAGFWPSPMALESAPAMAEGMNKAEKIVFSKTLKKAEWSNTRLMNDNVLEEMKKLKNSPGKDMTILGSGSIVTQFAEHGLIDEFQVMVDPIALGNGTPLFKNLKHKLDLKLTSSKVFKSGVVLLCYQPV